ncbi:MAG: DNA polymerase III subunit gamma/tau, partial [Oscillospiraceae bacterium]|nr:DNA polymerase III subunit gamma/tau [Oscillospiraceae bacterium]
MYTALYRKWRPLTFDDVVSQPHITKTLSRQIQEGKTAHAYLFTGSRGTGKTTCARIFAKAINCLNPHDGEPCLECEICRTADDGMLNDIIEIDAASNTGVDDIRDLRESTVYTPELCKYKVYIIDEVHMLSNQAFNALLKIMEEPPKYIKFILATTEIHKVPATVVSRCQRFDFRRIRQEDIVARLTYISEQEGATLSPEAASLIARLSDGAMRDALSLLDRCMAFTNEITAETVSEAAGVAGRDYLFRLLNAFADKNATEALNITDDLYSKSKDMHRLCDELVFQLRNLMLIKTAPENKQLLDCLPSEVGELEALAKKLTLTEVLDKLSILQQSGEAMQRAVSKRTELETAFIRICSATASNSVDAQVLLRKIDRLEQEILELKANGVKV